MYTRAIHTGALPGLCLASQFGHRLHQRPASARVFVTCSLPDPKVAIHNSHWHTIPARASEGPRTSCVECHRPCSWKPAGRLHRLQRATWPQMSVRAAQPRSKSMQHRMQQVLGIWPAPEPCFASAQQPVESLQKLPSLSGMDLCSNQKMQRS